MEAPAKTKQQYYFRSTHPTMGIVDRLGKRHTFGIPTPNWLITDDPELADFIRDDFVGRKGLAAEVTEGDEFSYQAAITINTEIEPFPEGHLNTTAEMDQFSKGMVNSVHIPKSVKSPGPGTAGNPPHAANGTSGDDKGTLVPPNTPDVSSVSNPNPASNPTSIGADLRNDPTQSRATEHSLSGKFPQKT